jgi:hypothetical protein
MNGTTRFVPGNPPGVATFTCDMAIQGCGNFMCDKRASSSLQTSEAALLAHCFVAQQTYIYKDAMITQLLDTSTGSSRIDIFASDDNSGNTSIHAALPTRNPWTAISPDGVATRLKRNIECGSRSLATAGIQCHLFSMWSAWSIVPAACDHCFI